MSEDPRIDQVRAAIETSLRTLLQTILPDDEHLVQDFMNRIDTNQIAHETIAAVLNAPESEEMPE